VVRSRSVEFWNVLLSIDMEDTLAVGT